LFNLGRCVVFGCGVLGRKTYNKLKFYYDVVAFCDNNSALYGKYIEGVLIVPIKQMLDYAKEGAKIVVSNLSHYRQIAVQLTRLGVEKVYVMNDGFSFLYGDGEMHPVSLLPKNEYYKKNSNEKLSVLFVQYYPNIRTARIAKVLKSLNCEVSVAYYNAPHQRSTIDVFDNNCYCFSTYDELVDWANNSEFDVITVANGKLAILLIHSNKKIVLDVQDLFSLYKNLSSSELRDEFIENSYCDGVIHTTEAVRDIAIQKYGLDKNKTHVIENFPLSDCCVTARHRKLSEDDGMIHVVYNGDIAFTDSRDRDFAAYWRKLAEVGVHVHIYSSLIGYTDLQELIESNPFIHYEGNLSSMELANEMTKYDCGWIMFNTEEGTSKVHLDYCSTNKLFEYLNSGLPMIIGDSKCHREFAEKYRCGGGLNFENDIISQLNEISSLKIPDDFIMKNGFTMENQAHDILAFYKSIAEL